MSKNKNKGKSDKAAKPDVQVSKDKKKKTGKVPFKFVGSKDPKEYPFNQTIPEGFDFKVHKSLKKRDFGSDHFFYLYRAAELDLKAAAFRKQAEDAEKLGSAKDRGRLKRLVKLQDKVSELRQQLESQGIDVNELLEVADEETK